MKITILSFLFLLSLGQKVGLTLTAGIGGAVAQQDLATDGPPEKLKLAADERTHGAESTDAPPETLAAGAPDGRTHGLESTHVKQGLQSSHGTKDGTHGLESTKPTWKITWITNCYNTKITNISEWYDEKFNKKITGAVTTGGIVKAAGAVTMAWAVRHYSFCIWNRIAKYIVSKRPRRLQGLAQAISVQYHTLNHGYEYLYPHPATGIFTVVCWEVGGQIGKLVCNLFLGKMAVIFTLTDIYCAKKAHFDNTQKFWKNVILWVSIPCTFVMLGSCAAAALYIVEVAGFLMIKMRQMMTAEIILQQMLVGNDIDDGYNNDIGYDNKNKNNNDDDDDDQSAHLVPQDESDASAGNQSNKDSDGSTVPEIPKHPPINNMKIPQPDGNDVPRPPNDPVDFD